jgi:hypothetical protein
MACAAASAFYLGTIEGRPYANPFTVLETLLTEMHLHCLTAPDCDEGIAFQANLHRDPLVKRETAIFEQLRALCLAEDPVDIERFARSNILSIAELEPELTQGLAADR